MADLVQQITEVLREHAPSKWIQNGGAPEQCCVCPWVGPDHSQHQAEVLVARLKCAIP